MRAEVMTAAAPVAFFLLAAGCGTPSARSITPDEFHLFGSHGWGSATGGLDRGESVDSFSDSSVWSITTGFTWSLPQPGDDPYAGVRANGWTPDGPSWWDLQPSLDEGGAPEQDGPEEPFVSRRTIEAVAAVLGALAVLFAGVKQSNRPTEALPENSP